MYPKALYRYYKSLFSQLVDSKKPQFMPNVNVEDSFSSSLCVVCLFNIQNQALSVFGHLDMEELMKDVGTDRTTSNS